NIRNAPYYNANLEMVAKHEQRIAIMKEGGKKKTAPKADKPMKPIPTKQTKPATAKQPKPKPIKDKSTKLAPLQKADKDKMMKAHTVKNAETGADTDNVIIKGDTEILNIGEEQGEDVDNQEYLEEQTVVLDEGQARSDPDKTLES
nr:hypothetical protein [Tanacetum cinerariifolium]